MERDLIHILGGSFGDDPIPGAVGALRAIYRVSSEVAESGREFWSRRPPPLTAEPRRSSIGTRTCARCSIRSFSNRHRDFDRLIASLL